MGRNISDLADLEQRAVGEDALLDGAVVDTLPGVASMKPWAAQRS